MLERKLRNPCLATCSPTFTTLFKGGRGLCLLEIGNWSENMHLLRVESRCSNYFWRALSFTNFKGGQIEHDQKALYRGFRWCSFHWWSQNCDLVDSWRHNCSMAHFWPHFTGLWRCWGINLIICRQSSWNHIWRQLLVFMQCINLVFHMSLKNLA